MATTRSKARLSATVRRSQLLRAAIDVFAQRGFAGTKTRDIALAAGVSEAILFRHFATKEKLYHAILDAKQNENKEANANWRRTLEDYARRRDDAALIRHLALKTFASFRQDPAFHRLMVYASLEGHLMAGLFRERFAQPMGGFLRQYIAMRQKEGAFRKCSPELATGFILASIVHWAMGIYVFGLKRVEMSEEQVAAELVALVLGGLREKTGGANK